MTRNNLVKKVTLKMIECHDIFFTIGTCYHYKRLCIETKKGYENVFDTSTDIWRPLNIDEMQMILDEGFLVTNQNVILYNELRKLKENRRMFHIATVKKNLKEKEFYFNIAKRAIKKLKSLL